MASLAQQTRAMVHNIRSSAQNRRETVARLQSDSREFVRAAATHHQEETSRARDRINDRVQELATETREFLETCTQQRNELTNTLSRMAEDVAHAADEVRHGLVDRAAARLEAFRHMHDNLAARVSALADSTQEFLTSCETKRAEAFHDLHSRIDSRLTDLAQDVRNLRHGARSTLQRFRSELEDLRADVCAAGEAWLELARAHADFTRGTGGAEAFSPAVESYDEDGAPEPEEADGDGPLTWPQAASPRASRPRSHTKKTARRRT